MCHAWKIQGTNWGQHHHPCAQISNDRLWQRTHTTPEQRGLLPSLPIPLLRSLSWKLFLHCYKDLKTRITSRSWLGMSHSIWFSTGILLLLCCLRSLCLNLPLKYLRWFLLKELPDILPLTCQLNKYGQHRESSPVPEQISQLSTMIGHDSSLGEDWIPLVHEEQSVSKVVELYLPFSVSQCSRARKKSTPEWTAWLRQTWGALEYSPHIKKWFQNRKDSILGDRNVALMQSSGSWQVTPGQARNQ